MEEKEKEGWQRWREECEWVEIGKRQGWEVEDFQQLCIRDGPRQMFTVQLKIREDRTNEILLFHSSLSVSHSNFPKFYFA